MVHATSVKRKRKLFVERVFYIFLIVLTVPVLYFQLEYFNKIHPGITVAGVGVGGLTKEQASETLSQKISAPEKLKLVNQDQTFEISTKDFDFSYDFHSSAARAFELTRTGNIFYDLGVRFNFLRQPKNLGLMININEEKINKSISVISGQDFIEPVYPSVQLVKGEVRVTKGSAGKEIDQEALRAAIGRNLSLADQNDIPIPIIVTDPSISDLGVTVVKERAEKFIGKGVTAKFEYQTYNISDADLVTFLNPHGGYYDEKINKAIEKIVQEVDREPQNPKFNFEGGKVLEFQPALDGIKTDREKFRANVLESINKLESGQDKSITFDVPVEKTAPEVSTSEVNNLGIREVIGRGTSTYYHSIPSRVHNVVLAASRINGTLVAPGETFSFNETLGDVSSFTGYKQAYIISDGKTILGDGGGVCQVSTTLFRSLLNGGLPITERTAHAYRVGYYEQGSPPGLDATVYGPSPDLKFRNDTPAHILIEAKADPKRYSLIFTLYGTSDGRVATISKSTVSNVSAPPEDLYQDDPTLTAGTIKQIDYKAWGAKVTFNYKVVRDGETLINKTFTSNYRPWQAIYLRGTAPSI
jgi:vancomycin resistance protein YoaR